MKKIVTFVVVLILLAAFSPPQNAGAQAEPFLGQIMMVGFTFCPRGWAECDGQLLPINTNQSLFSLLGTTYGGDGRTTFGLPDLRGRVPIHEGQGPSLDYRPQGSVGGQEENYIAVSQLPAHNHPAWASWGLATQRNAAGNLWAKGPAGNNLYRKKGPNNVQMDQSAIGEVGGGDSVENMQPYLTIKYCIALQGVYPSRN